MDSKLIQKLKAKFNKVPFFIKEHWPQYYTQCGRKFLKDKKFTVNIFNHYSEEGDVVDVLILDNTVYKYKITKISYAPGGDWGMYSPKQFDLQYHSKYKK